MDESRKYEKMEIIKIIKTDRLGHWSTFKPRIWNNMAPALLRSENICKSIYLFWSNSCATSDLSAELMDVTFGFIHQSIESRIVGWGSSLSHVSIQYARLMRPYKVKTCHVALVLSNEELWELVCESQEWLLIIYIYIYNNEKKSLFEQFK